MTNRERNLAVVVVGILGVAAVGFIAYQFVLSPWLEKNRMIAAKQKEIDEVQDEIDTIVLAKRKFEGARQQSLPNDPIGGVGVARQDYGDLLEHMCRRADLTGLRITASEPDSKSAPVITGKKTAYTKLSWDVAAKGDEYHLVEFLRLFYSQPLLHTIRTMTIQRPSEARGRTSRELDISLKVEALVLDNAPNRPTLLPVNREFALLVGGAAVTGVDFGLAQSGRANPLPPAGVLADNPPREYLPIAGKNIFFGPPPPGPVTPPTGPEDDISQFIVLTSITQDDDKDIVATFWDAYNNNDYTITQTPKGEIKVKGEWEIAGKKRLKPGYSEKNPGQLLLYGSEEGENLRVWRVRRVTTTEVILEKADRPRDEEEKPKPSGLSFVAGGAAVFAEVGEGKAFRVQVGQCLATSVAEGKDPIHPLPSPLLRREAYRAIFSPPPPPTSTASSDDRRR